MPSIRDLFGIEVPIVQAPMAGSQSSALAIAVSEAGALGSLPCALLTPDAIRREFEAVAASTRRPCNVNFFCHVPPKPDSPREEVWRRRLRPYYDELGLDVSPAPASARAPFSAEHLEILREYRPAVVSFHFGLPSPELLDGVRAIGAKIVSSATTVDEARWLEARGVDAIVAQGLEAGGHRGLFLSDDLTTQAGTLALVPQIVGAVRVPVIAAGGIADAAGVRAVLALGAAGVQIGTAYLCCQEATTSAVHRAALVSDAARHTAVTNVFTGRPARGIVNRLMLELGPISEYAPAFPRAAADVLPLRTAAEARGSGDFSPLWCGQNATGCRAVPAADLTRDFARGCG